MAKRRTKSRKSSQRAPSKRTRRNRSKPVAAEIIHGSGDLRAESAVVHGVGTVSSIGEGTLQAGSATVEGVGAVGSAAGVGTASAIGASPAEGAGTATGRGSAGEVHRMAFARQFSQLRAVPIR
jgi:hypothetical protein